MLTSEIEVIKCRNQTRQFCSTYRYKSLHMDKTMGIKAYTFFRFGYVSNILTIPSMIRVYNWGGGLQVSSRYFSKMLSIPRYRAYRPIPTRVTPSSYQMLSILFCESIVHWWLQRYKNPRCFLGVSLNHWRLCRWHYMHVDVGRLCTEWTG